MKKIIVYDEKGVPSQCIVFTGTTKSLNNQDIFSKIELEKMKMHNVTIKQCPAKIYDDDNIRSIKKKILKEFGETIYGYDEMYLFYEKKMKDVNNFYNEITNNGNIILDNYNYSQIIMNCKIPTHKQEHITAKKVYSKEDVDSLEVNEYKLYLPLGIKFSTTHDYRYSANPFDILQTQNVVYNNEGSNMLIAMENSLLFNHGDNIDTIHCCFAEQICNYALEKSLDEQYFINIYYPHLKKIGIENSSDLLKHRTKLLKTNKDIMKVATFKHYNSIEFLNSIVENKKGDINYDEKGHKKMSFIIHPTKKINIPMNSLFKVLHSSIHIPLIKYTSNLKKNNLIRIFTTVSQKSGKYVPIVSKYQVNKLSSHNNSPNSIAFNIDKNKNNMIIEMNSNGLLKVNVEYANIMNTNKSENFINAYLNNVIKSLNDILTQYNIDIQYFSSFEDKFVEIVNIDYHFVINSKNNIKLKPCIHLLSNVFDIIIKNDVFTMNYKRVENFKKMDAINKTINDVFKETNNDKEVIEALIQNYNMTQEEAMKKLSDFFASFTRINNRYMTKTLNIAECPGFPCVLKYDLIGQKIHFYMKDIINNKYLKFIDNYIESMLMITLYQENTNIDAKEIQGKCKIKPTEDVSHTETVISVVEEKEKIIQPMNFVSKDDENADDESDDDLLFDDDDDEEDEDESDDDEDMSGGDGKIINKNITVSDEVLEKGKAIDGKSLMRPNIFFERLEQRDPKLFLTKKQGKFDAYSRMCAFSESRQPVILTQQEKDEIDKNYQGSYDKSVEYGTGQEKFHYICPRYWCLLNNVSLTEEQVKDGQCGKVIPHKALTVPVGHYVYEFFNTTMHIDSKGKYNMMNPGFMNKNKHPDNLCIPCCFKNFDSISQKKRRDQCIVNNVEDNNNDENTKETENKQKNDIKIPSKNQYIIDFNTFPIPENRFGFLEPAYENLFMIDYNNVRSENNSHILKNNTPALLRYGVNNNDNKSFLECLAAVFVKEKKIKPRSIDHFIDAIISSITLDDFIRYNNGTLVSIFKNNDKIPIINIEDHRDTLLYKSLDLMNNTHEMFLEESIMSFENFKHYLKDKQTVVDHTYLWDLVCDPHNPILNTSYNLIIMEKDNSDITNNINFLCPTNSYSNNTYNPNNKTIMMIKQDNLYELITSVKMVSGEKPDFKLVFNMNEPNVESISEIMKNILKHVNKYCGPLNSMPKLYTFERNLYAIDVVGILINHDYHVANQVINYQHKVIGLQIKENEDRTNTFFIPTYPSEIIKKVEIVTIDDIKWDNYENTLKRLKAVYEKTGRKIKCIPKLKVLEDELVVGFLTMTNQFIQITPPFENTTTYDMNLKIEVLNDVNHIVADKVLNMEKEGNKKRLTMVRNIRLESDFYVAFKNNIRLIIQNDEASVEAIKYINNIINSDEIIYRNKMLKMTKYMSEIIKDHIHFVEYSDDVLDSIDKTNITSCLNNIDGDKPYCTVTENGTEVLSIPQYNLNDDSIDNSVLYVEKISDEIIRNKDTQQYLLSIDATIRFSDIYYNINRDEIIISNDSINTVFKDDNIISKAESFYKYIGQNTYYNATPEISQEYSDIIVRTPDIEDVESGSDACIVKNSAKLIGNSSWNKKLKQGQEVLFSNSVTCSFYVCCYLYNIMYSKDIDMINVKKHVFDVYDKYMNPYYDNIKSILKNQGKSKYIDKLNNDDNELSLFDIIIDNNDYVLSNLDLIAFVEDMKIPVVLFSNTNFIEMRINKKYIIIDSNNLEKQKYFFIRCQRDTKNNTYQYSIIKEPMYLTDLKDFEYDMDNKKTVYDILDNFSSNTD